MKLGFEEFRAASATLSFASVYSFTDSEVSSTH
jgi:hypothetical protein